MDKKDVIEIVKDYAEAVKDNFPVRKIILYGSHAKGQAREDSDIDVAVVLDSGGGNYLIAASRLFRLSRDIDLRIEPLLLESGTDVSGFLDEIIKTGKIIYNAD